MTHSPKKGFTLLELLIVITILAILTLVVVLFINPVEILKKSRDVQRMSDLDVLRTGINLYLQDSSSNKLTGVLGGCWPGAASDTAGAGNAIRTSLAGSSTTATSTITFTNTAATYYATSSSDLARNDGKGWIPNIDFTSVRTGAPVAKLPIDPINTAISGGVPGIDSLYYRYACKTDNTFELDATLESATYGPGSSDDKAAKDGGGVTMRYEVGTNLKLLPSTAPVL